MKMKRLSCPRPDKTPHRFEREAIGAAKAAMRKGVVYQEMPPLYVYQCRCRRWHVTHRPEWNGTPNRLAVQVTPELQAWARGVDA